jgi:hypothetical protein
MIQGEDSAMKLCFDGPARGLSAAPAHEWGGLN